MNFCHNRQTCPKSGTIWRQGWGVSDQIQKPGGPCNHTFLVCSISSCRIHCCFNPTSILVAHCVYHITQLTWIAEKSALLCSWEIISPSVWTIYPFHNFLTIYEWSPLPMSSESICSWSICLAFFLFFMIHIWVSIFPSPLMSRFWVGQCSYHLYLLVFLALM